MSSFTHPENKNRYIRCCLLSSAQHSITSHPLSGFENDTLSDIFDLYIFFIFVWIFIIHASAWKQNFCLLVYSAAPLEATTISKLIVSDQPTSVLSPWKPERGLLTLFFFFFSPPNGKVCGKSSVWPGDLFEFDLSENKSSSRVCLQDQEALGPPAEQQLHQRPARGAALSPTRESPFFFSFVLLPSSSVCWNTSKTTL